MTTALAEVGPDRGLQVTVALALMEGLERASGKLCPVAQVPEFIKAALCNQIILPDGSFWQGISPAQSHRANSHVMESMRKTGVTLVVDSTISLIPTHGWI